MKRIIIIGEGQTEQSFCNDVLQPHFVVQEIYLQNTITNRNSGGIINWSALKHQIERHLLQDPNVIVTTLIDYYGIYANHYYPQWEIIEKKADLTLRLNALEKAMLNDLSISLRARYIPYIQLHEFEGLLFSDKKVFDDNFEDNEFEDYDYLVNTIEEHENPELINKGHNTAPSKRLKRILKGYKKVIYGSLIAQSIGLNTIRNKCPRFNNWISQLEKI
jgi:hypothetical protein